MRIPSDARQWTSITRTQFDDLLAEIEDGSAVALFAEIEGKDESGMSRKQRVRFRQLTWLASLINAEPDVFRGLANGNPWKDWKEIRVFIQGDGNFITTLRSRVLDRQNRMHAGWPTWGEQG